MLANLLATGAAFGVAKLIFQDGHLAGLLGFESQGFLDAWGPVFFFAMIFAIAMDYTVFLLSSAREHWEESEDPRAAMIGSLAHSGRVILAAGAVMVAVFFTFALSGPLPPKEMGVILGIAVLLDAFLVRLTLLPVFLRLAGRAAWYLPAWLDRILPAVHFGHGHPAEPTAGAVRGGASPRAHRRLRRPPAGTDPSRNSPLGENQWALVCLLGELDALDRLRLTRAVRAVGLGRLDRVDRVHPVADPAEDRVLAVQPRRRLGRDDEEL